MAYEVEFVTDAGETVAILTLTPREIRPFATPKHTYHPNDTPIRDS